MISEQMYSETAQNRGRLTDTLIAFIKTDAMLFAFNDECLQDYQSIVAKANEVLNTAFTITTGLNIAEANFQQDNTLKAYLNNLSVKRFTLLYLAAIKVRSVLLGILFTEHLIAGDQFFKIAYYEELWQQNKWGTTSEAEERHQLIKKDLAELERVRNEIGLLEN